MDERYSDAYLRDILKRTKNIAVVGVSPNPQRPSYFVARYLGLKGFNVISVNPGHAGKELFGATIRASLSEIEEPIDMTIWMQIGVTHLEAAEKARAKGIDVIMNRCPKIEYQRLFWELRMAGFNTGVISSKLS